MKNYIFSYTYTYVIGHSILAQLWKYNDTKLENKFFIWMDLDEGWTLPNEEAEGYIKNVSGQALIANLETTGM